MAIRRNHTTKLEADFASGTGCETVSVTAPKPLVKKELVGSIPKKKAFWPRVIGGGA
jgi:hypothetical protein